MSKFTCILGAALMLSGGMAQARTIDFEASTDQYYIPSYTEGAYVMSVAHDGVMGTLGSNSFGAGRHLQTWTNTGDVSGFVLTRQDGGTFELFAVRYGNGVGDHYPQTFVVTGTTASGDTLSATMDYSTANPIKLFGPEWTGLSSVDFAAYGLYNRASFDDIVVFDSVVPEAGTLPMMLLGFAGIGWLRTRKKGIRPVGSVFRLSLEDDSAHKQRGHGHGPGAVVSTRLNTELQVFIDQVQHGGTPNVALRQFCFATLMPW